ILSLNITVALRRGFMVLDRLQVIAEQREHLIDLVHTNRWLSLLDLADKAQPDPAAPGQLLLGQVRLSPQFFQRRCYTRKGIRIRFFHCYYTLAGIIDTFKTDIYTRTGALIDTLRP